MVRSSSFPIYICTLMLFTKPDTFKNKQILAEQAPNMEHFANMKTCCKVCDVYRPIQGDSKKT